MCITVYLAEIRPQTSFNVSMLQCSQIQDAKIAVKEAGRNMTPKHQQVSPVTAIQCSQICCIALFRCQACIFDLDVSNINVFKYHILAQMVSGPDCHLNSGGDSLLMLVSRLMIVIPCFIIACRLQTMKIHAPSLQLWAASCLTLQKCFYACTGGDFNDDEHDKFYRHIDGILPNPAQCTFVQTHRWSHLMPSMTHCQVLTVQLSIPSRHVLHE